MKRVKTLRGCTIALTGFCTRPRAELIKLIKQSGGHVIDSRARITKNTDILVRGVSAIWKHGTYGRKEARAAELIRNGYDLSVILDDDLERLFKGRTVYEFSPIAGKNVQVLRDEAEARKKLKKPVQLDKLRITNQRTEQGMLRVLHLKGRRLAKCSICNRSLPVSLLVIGHIKQRSRCSLSEKRDLQNIAMPICLLGCDALYDKGFITVSPKGHVVVTKNDVVSSDLPRSLARVTGRHCLAHSSSTEPYFKWHRCNVFLGRRRD